jgi:hypothetical protein
MSVAVQPGHTAPRRIPAPRRSSLVTWHGEWIAEVLLQVPGLEPITSAGLVVAGRRCSRQFASKRGPEPQSARSIKKTTARRPTLHRERVRSALPADATAAPARPGNQYRRRAGGSCRQAYCVLPTSSRRFAVTLCCQSLATWQAEEAAAKEGLVQHCSSTMMTRCAASFDDPLTLRAFGTVD